MQNNQDRNDQGLNLVDLAVYLASKWKWYILSLLVCCGLAYYHYAKTPLTYFRSATIIIKDPSNKTVSAGLDRFDNYINKVNVANELLQFQSKNIIREVITRLNADVDYKVKTKLRFQELYTDAPVKVNFKNVMPERSIAFDLTIKSDKEVVLSNFQGLPGAKSSYKVKMNDSITVQSETIQVYPTDRLSKQNVGLTLHIIKKPVGAVVAYYRSNLGIRQESEESSIITLSLKDNNGNRAEDVLNTLINVYNEEALADKNQVSVNSANFINDRLIIIEKELGGVESDLLKYRVNNNIVNLAATTSQSIGQISAYGDEVVQQETQKKVAQYMKDYLVDPSKNSDLIPSNSGIGDSEIETQISQYNNLKLKRDRLIQDSSEENPVVEEVNKAMHDLKQSVVRAIDNKIVSIDVKRNDALRQQMYAQGRVNAVPLKEQGMLTIERQQKIKESLYLFLLNKREENALAQAMADNNARIIDSAEGSSLPISPDRNKILLLGFLLGLALPSVVFLFTMFMDTKVHSRKDFQGKTSIPFLGEIPYDAEKNKKRRKKLTPEEQEEEDKHGMTAEAFKILRTNMTFMKKRGQKVQVITFTSFNEGAGKTFISSHLGKALADGKKKVIMVDLDIRKRTLSHLFTTGRHQGVTNYLADDSIQLSDIIHHHDKMNVDYILGGHAAPNPAELLMDERLDKMIEELRKDYDYIIADNVPCGVVADATITNRISDLTIFVVRAGRLDRRQIPDMESLYTEGKLQNMSMVLNGVDPKYRGYGYRYGYGYGYGYGHRYGYGEEKKKKK